MKYISLINRFWSLNAVEPFGRTDTAVYLYLLNQCNLRHWQNPFTITLHQIEVAVNITRKTVSASLKRLEKRGLLTTKSRRYLPTTVILADSDSLFKAQSKSTLRETSMQLSGTHQAHITTHIKRVKNINDKQLKKHSIECKKSESEIKNNRKRRPAQCPNQKLVHRLGQEPVHRPGLKHTNRPGQEPARRPGWKLANAPGQEATNAVRKLPTHRRGQKVMPIHEKEISNKPGQWAGASGGQEMRCGRVRNVPPVLLRGPNLFVRHSFFNNYC